MNTEPIIVPWQIEGEQLNTNVINEYVRRGVPESYYNFITESHK